MNFSDISKIDISDLKNLDYRKIKDDLLSKKDVLLNVVLVVTTIFTCIYIYTTKKDALNDLKNNTVLLEEKIVAADAHNAAQKELSEYIKGVPKGVSKDELITTLSDFASARNVKISTFSAVSSSNMNLYDLVGVSLTVTASSYNDMWHFMNDIETSPYALRIQNWTVQTGTSRMSARNQKNATMNLVAQISLGTVMIKK